jgi:hypothetical protein
MDSVRKYTYRDVTKYMKYKIEDKNIINDIKMEIEPFNEAYNGLLDTMNNTFDAEINTYTLLLGNPGMGKSSAVYYAYTNCKYNETGLI